MRRSRSGRFLGGLLGTTILITAALVAPALASAATAKVTFSLLVDSNCVEGYGPLNRSLHLVWRNSGGGLKSDAVVTTSAASGYWSHCSSGGTFLAKGDRLKAIVGTYVRKFTVPPLSVQVDRVHDNFHGTAPAGSAVTLWYVHTGCCADFEQHADLVADSAGNWSFDEDYPTDRFYGRIEWNSAKGDFVQAEEQAAAVSVVIGSSAVSVKGDPNHGVRVVLRDGQTGARRGVAKGLTDQYGLFQGTFLNASGHAVKVAVGDKIDGRSVSSDMKFTVRTIEVAVDVLADVIDGRCINPSVSGSLFVLRNGESRGYAFLGLEADGSFSIWMGDGETLGYDPANIHRGDKIRVTCNLAKGDALTTNYVVR